ncbi:adenylate kinase 9-like [Metopolophium dirhodum]|uniref:adenylate kinase 9-like n=1 Tax=Metopolophium dirhodum TaxID=44670 RepID=UPI0029906D4A|nr:adenylate kinase 9-like [Metopolophium dirhodum]
MDAVFTTNPPDILIYMSCRNQDLSHIHNGLTLESMEQDHLTQTLHLNDVEYNHRRVHWYYKSFVNQKIIELDVKDYENYSLKVIDEKVKQFDPARVITLDGRKPVDELMETIKAKLMTMSLQYTVLPKIVNFQDKSISSEDYAYDGTELLFEAESTEAETVANNDEERASDTMSQLRDEHLQRINDRNEQIRVMSEFGRLCPVNYFNGRFIMGSDRHCMKFMGKSYYFAGPDEMKSFGKCPKQFLRIPGCRLPIRAMFYGPQTLTNPAAKAVRKFFGYNLIDVGHLTQIHEKDTRHAYSTAIVGSILKTVREIIRPKEIRPNDISTMRNAIADWTRLRFDFTIQSDLNGMEDEESEYEMYEEFSHQKKQNMNEFFKKRQLMRLKNYFESYDIDFLDDLYECIRVYDEPESLTKYFQNMSKKNRKIFRSNFINTKKNIQPDLINVVVDTVQIKNQQNINWIIVNAPLDFVLVKKLIDEGLKPIQMVFFHDSDPMHNVLLLNDEISNNYRNNYEKILENVQNGKRYGTAVERIKYPEFVKKTENSLDISIIEDEFFEDEVETAEYEENVVFNVNYISHDHLMEIIVPEISERLNQYTENLLVEWQTLKHQISKETDQTMNFNIIVCKPNSTTNLMRLLIEDTLYYIKKFLTDNVYDVSTSDIEDAIPTKGKYDGDTSIYCPVRFAKGKLSIGSKNHMAVYHNRYYFMSSSNDFKDFISNPNKYTLFTSIPKMYPKPKISLLFSFGLSSVDFINKILGTFDLTLVDSYKVFKQNVLPKNMPMVGKMYEEPTLREILDKYFIPENQKDNINSLRKYMDRESAYLKDEDWLKMNSIFFQANEGICYTNYPKNLTELKYLKENEINPDIIIEVNPERNVAKEHATASVIQNWLTYQYILIDKIIARDNKTRRDSVNNRSIFFKQKLSELVKQKEIDRLKIRLERIIKMIAVETTIDGPNEVKYICDKENQQSDKSFSKSPLTTTADLLTRYSELTLKQKKIIIDRGLDVNDFIDLDDFDTLDEIDEMINNEFPDDNYMISQCFSDGFAFPSNAMIDQYLDMEKGALSDMREFAETSNIPWITVSGPDSQSAAMSKITEVLGTNTDAPFESTYEVDLETAEDMLRAGEVHLSQFGRWCPVQAFREGSADHPSVRQFCQDLADGHVNPVVHRKYVYYVAGGPENRDEFTRQPLKYVLGQSGMPPSPSSFPLKIAVVGPPGSGKSRCAQELCFRFGLQLIRIEDAINAYLKEYQWTDVAKAAIGTLRRGDALSEETLAEVVTTATFGGRATTWGYVIDGYPVTEKQFKLLDGTGVMLHAVFVLQKECRPEGSLDDDTALLRLRRGAWREVFPGLLWISARYGNATGFAATDTDGMAAAASACVRSVLAYRTDVHCNRPSRLYGVPVTGCEYQCSLSTYLDLCPVCKVDCDRLTRSPNPAAMRRFSVQYRAYIYWTCGPEHEVAFIGDPDRYADAAPVTPLPHPVPTTDSLLSLNPYFRYNLSSEYCVVCALSCLWYPEYKRGRPDLMVTYGNRAYTFCSSQCKQAFSQQPSLYAGYTMRVSGPERSLSTSPRPLDQDYIDSLPVPGYLEQTVASHVSSALVELSAIKPVYPGLTPNVSAMVYLGLHIGMNGSCDKDVAEYYHNAFKRFVDTCQRFKIEAFKLKALM